MKNGNRRHSRKNTRRRTTWTSSWRKFFENGSSFLVLFVFFMRKKVKTKLPDLVFFLESRVGIPDLLTLCVYVLVRALYVRYWYAFHAMKILFISMRLKSSVRHFTICPLPLLQFYNNWYWWEIVFYWGRLTFQLREFVSVTKSIIEQQQQRGLSFRSGEVTSGSGISSKSESPM